MTRTEKATQRKEQQERIARVQAEAGRIVSTGVCPDCGAPLRRNWSLSGWWQCSQYGAVGFRANADKPSCSFQCFTA